MAKRRVERGAGRDDELIKVGVAPPAATQTNVADHVLGLQRDYGNQAVTTMVQRKGGAKKGGGKGAAKVENFLPEWDASINSSAGELRQSANPMINAPEEWQVRKGIHWYEQAYLREKSENTRRMDALVIGRAYEKLGDGARAAWWKKVHIGEIDPFAGEKRHA